MAVLGFFIWGLEPLAMASAVARAYAGVWGLCPQWDPGAKPVVRGLRSPEADEISANETHLLH